MLRRVELWPIAKVAFLFHLCCYLVTLGVAAAAWKVILGFGTVENLEKFLSQSSGIENFRIDGPTLFRVVAYGGAVLVGLNTVGTVLMAFLYNRLSALFGGLVFSVLTDGPVVVPAGSTVVAAEALPTGPGAVARPTVVARESPPPPARRRPRPSAAPRRRPARLGPPLGAPAVAAPVGSGLAGPAGADPADAPGAPIGSLWGDDD